MINHYTSGKYEKKVGTKFDGEKLIFKFLND